MNQKVFVQGREIEPLWIEQEYVRPKDKRNSFSEIHFSQINLSPADINKEDRPRGFHVIRIGTQNLVTYEKEIEERIANILNLQKKIFYPADTANDEIKKIRKKLYSKLEVKSS